MHIDSQPIPARRDMLAPLPYHLAIRDYFKSEEPDLWKWFSSNRVRTEYADRVRLGLLKTTYRLEAQSHPELYSVAEDVLARLQLKVPITFYQAQSASGLNAELAFLPEEAHIVFIGSVLSSLSAAELKALIGHELAHFLLFSSQNGELLVALEILEALSNDAAARPSHQESARLFGLYSEIFADRGAWVAIEDTLVNIALLVKTSTGLLEVNAESYLRQADEIFSAGGVKAEQATHPETYIRARAIQLFADRAERADQEIERIIEGSTALNRLDVLKQQKIALSTRRLLEHFLAPCWFQTEPVIAHARMFFDDFVSGCESAVETTLAEEIRNAEESLRDYYCYVLLDFVAVDRDLEEIPLAAALVLCERLGLAERFAEIAPRELHMTKKRFAAIERDRAKILESVNASTSAS
jgi:hypothetical protein